MNLVSFVKQKTPRILLGVFLILLYFWSTKHSVGWTPDRKYSAPPKNLVHLSFGFSEVMADSFWLRSIQDFDYCENQIEKHLCSGQGWLFQILDVTTDLSPKFRMPLAAGPLALSIIISDIEGASKLFDKAALRFPKDWPILYRAAYHSLYEEKNNSKAAGLLIRAAQNGAPQWAYSLAARLYTEDGKRELAERILSENEGIPKELQDRIRLKISQAQKR